MTHVINISKLLFSSPLNKILSLRRKPLMKTYSYKNLHQKSQDPSDSAMCTGTTSK